MRSLPSSPLATISRIFRIGGAKLCGWPPRSLQACLSHAAVLAPRVGRGGDLHVRELRDRREDLRAGDAEAAHAHPERGHRRALASSSTFFVCCLMSVDAGIKSEIT